MKPFTFQAPPNILFEAGASRKLPEIVAGYGVTRVLLVTDKGGAYMSAELRYQPYEAFAAGFGFGAGEMGFGGRTTLLGVKISALNRLPASFFVSVSYMCWAYRRRGIELSTGGDITKWLY